MSEHSQRISVKELINYVNKNWDHFDSKESVLVSSDDESCINTHSNFYPLKFNLETKLDSIGNNLDDILSKINEDFRRIGILTNIDDMGDADISLYASILWLLKDGFSNLKRQEQSQCVKDFIKSFKLDSQSIKFEEFGYKSLGWTTKQLLQDIKNGEVGTTVIRYLADYLHINIFILNVTDSKLYYSGSHPWIQYKKNVLLVRHTNNNFEPVFTDQTKIFGVESKLVSFLLMKTHMVDVMYCDMNLNEPKKFKDGEENLENYMIEDDKPLEESEAMNKFDENTDVGNFDDSDKSDSDNENIQNMVYSTKMNKQDEKSSDSNTLSSMSYDKLQTIAAQNNINIYKVRNGKKILKNKTQLSNELENITSNHSDLDESENESEGIEYSDDNSTDTDTDTDISDDNSISESDCDTPDYSTYKVPELRKLATKCGISLKKGNKFKTKQDLITELDNHYN